MARRKAQAGEQAGAGEDVCAVDREKRIHVLVLAEALVPADPIVVCKLSVLDRGLRREKLKRGMISIPKMYKGWW